MQLNTDGLNMRTYAAPKLTVYGSVAALTASGTGASCENGSIPNNGGQCSNNQPTPSATKKP